MPYRPSTKNLPHLIQNVFWPLFNLRLAKYIFRNFPANRHHIVKREGSWTTSIGLYLELVMIWIDLLPTNFQLNMMSSSWMTSPSFFMSQLNLLPEKFQMNVKWYSHSPVSENTSEDNSPPKLSCTIICFCLWINHNLNIIHFISWK